MSQRIPFETKKIIHWALKLLVLILLVCIFVPFSPKMPATGLDASWAMALNQAVAQGLSFGKHIIFTLGPYASIYTKVYHPATDLMMISGSLYLACTYWLALVMLMDSSKWHWPLVFSLVLLGMAYAKDSLFFSYPLIVGLISFKIVFLEDRNKYATLIVGFLFAPLGLLPLIKGSLLILSTIMTLLSTLLFLAKKKRALVLMTVGSPCIALIFFWVVAGQQVADLPAYFSNSISMASGFTEAMANEGDYREIIVYLIASFFILLALSWQQYTPRAAKAFLLCIVFVFLFLSFKAGFTRHYGHAFIASTSIVLAGLLISYLFRSKLTLFSFLISLCTASYIDEHYTHMSISNNLVSTYTSAWHGLSNRVSNKDWLQHDFDLTMDFMRKRSAFPSLQGTTDIYSYNQSDLIASGLTWNPRPIFQSYSVFTSAFAMANKAHLVSAHRPDNIMFRIEPIDEKIPSLEDGASWPILLKNYQPVNLSHGYLLLHAKDNINTINDTMPVVKKERHSFDEIVNIPQSIHPVFAEIEMKPTFWGLMALTFFKSSPIQIRIQLKNGTERHYHLIANMAKSGFLISPLIENTTEFALLYHHQNQFNDKFVQSFLIAVTPKSSWLWSTTYSVRFKSLRI